jgi:hypothetical protein
VDHVGDEIANPRKEELRQVLRTLRSLNQGVPDILQPARDALEGGAWTGGASAAFAADLTGQHTTAVEAGDAAVEVARQAWASEPSTIPAPDPAEVG